MEYADQEEISYVTKIDIRCVLSLIDSLIILVERSEFT